MIKLSLYGRLASDVKEIKTKDDKIMNTFSVVSRRDKDNTDFIDCVAFSDTIGKYFKKGDRITIYGNLTFDKYEKDGKKQTKAKVIVDSFEFVETKKEN